MTRVLFALLPEKGHIHPMLGPAESLLARGCELAYYAPVDIRGALAPLGATRCYFGAAASPSTENRGAAFADRARDPAALRAWIAALLLDGVDSEVARLDEAIADFRPDVIVSDPMFYAAPIAAHRAEVPWAALSNSLNPVLPPSLDSELLATVRALAPARDELFARYGLAARFSGCDCLSPYFTCAFTTEALVGDAPDGVTLVGPSRMRGARGDSPAFDLSRLDARRPLIYLSLGSQNFHHPAIFRCVFEAVRERPVQLVAAVGDLFETPSLGALPKNVITLRYAPQLDLLSHARAVISHGGANSVMEALDAGVPILLTPLCNDQPHNAHFVERAGAGVVLRLDHTDSASCGRAIDSLLHSPELRAGAERIARSYRARDGATLAAEAILGLAR